MSMRSLSGVLNPQGDGVLALSVPNHSSLIGWNLYFKVVVEGPAGGESLWTLSPLGQTEIVP